MLDLTTPSHTFKNESYVNTAKLMQSTCFKNMSIVSQVQIWTSKYLFPGPEHKQARKGWHWDTGINDIAESTATSNQV